MAKTDETEEALAIARRALWFYADTRNWKEDSWGCISVISTPDYGDGGKRARNALKRIGRILG